MPTPKEHLDWCVNRALEYFDQGSKRDAIASFLSDVGKHEGTAHILYHPMTLFIIKDGYDNGREAFRRSMEGFAV